MLLWIELNSQAIQRKVSGDGRYPAIRLSVKKSGGNPVEKGIVGFSFVDFRCRVLLQLVYYAAIYHLIHTCKILGVILHQVGRMILLLFAP